MEEEDDELRRLDENISMILSDYTIDIEEKDRDREGIVPGNHPIHLIHILLPVVSIYFHLVVLV